MEKTITINGVKYVRLADVKQIADALSALTGGGIVQAREPVKPTAVSRKAKRRRSPGSGRKRETGDVIAAVAGGATTVEGVAAITGRKYANAASALSREVRRGTVRRLSPGVYTPAPAEAAPQATDNFVGYTG